MKLVLDASVAAKWLVPERDSDKAKALFESWNDGQIDLIAPTLLTAEIASMLWKRATRGLMSAAEALRLFQEFSDFGLALSPIQTLATSALRLSVAYRHPFYDCLYVALALREGCDLLTSDAKLFNAFSPVFPHVRLLTHQGPLH